MVIRAKEAGLAIPWKLLGVHSSRMEMSGRDVTLDEALSLNCAWYADVLMAVTQDGGRIKRSASVLKPPSAKP